MTDSNKIRVAFATAIGLGAIIGAGIFVLSGTAIAFAGADAILAFILVGIVAIIIAFEYGELGSIMPTLHGATYSYVYKAFGSELGFITGILLYASFAVSVSVIALGFGAYFVSLFNLTINPIIIAIILIFALSLVNLKGIKKAAKSDAFLVLIKVSILIIFIIFAILFLLNSKATNILSNFSVKGNQGNLESLIEAVIVIIFAYSGFQSISSITPEVEGGAKSAAKAIIYSVAISMIIYVSVVVSLIILAPASKYSISGDPLAIALQSSSAPQWLLILIDFGALIATTSATLAMILSSSKILYQISEDKLLPKFFRLYDKKNGIAINGVIITAIIAIITLFAGNIFVITSISDFGLLFSYLITSFALIHFRRKKIEGSIKTPFYPYFPIISIIMIIIFMYGLPKESLLIGLIAVILLLTIYYSLREVENKKVIRIKLFK
ncbi:MAG: APC family permease [Candidatus Micrarchaeia archaeon]